MNHDIFEDEKYIEFLTSKSNKEKKRMIIKGKAKWAKIIGAPHFGYENAFKLWSVDVYIDEATKKKLVAEGLKDNIKDKGEGPFITFKRKELKFDGTKNNPIRIVDHKGQPWDGSKIGNGSVVNVNFLTNEYKKGKFSLNILSLQVWEHVPFTGGEFPTREDDDTNEGEDWTSEVA